MESVEIGGDVSERDINGVKEADHRTLKAIFSHEGNDCSISAGADVLVEKRNDDATLRLMGHSIIPAFIDSEEGFASSVPTLKQRFRNLRPLSEAVELTDRVATLTRSIHREHDSHFHLEEKDDANLSKTNSLRTVNSLSNPRRRDHQRSDARARRRERLNSDSTMSTSQLRLNSSRQIYSSSGLSSPEPVTLREVRKDPAERMRQFSSLVDDRYSSNDDTMREAVLPNLSVDHRYEITEEATSNDGNLSSVAKSPSFITTNCPFVTRRRTPMKFGGYRPTSGLIFRNLSSDSESDAALDRFVPKGSSKRIIRYRDASNIVPCDSKERKIIQGSEFAWSNSYCSTPERTAKVRSFPVEKLHALEDELRSPAPSARSRISFEDPGGQFETSSGPQFLDEGPWAPLEDSRSPLGDVENLTDENHDVHQFEDLRNEPYNSFLTKELAAASNAFRDRNPRPEIPQLEIGSQDPSESRSPSPECKVETIASSLDVKALIRALSSVSVKQEELEKRRSRSTMREKPPFEYKNRFSGSSGPRSSEYTPAADPGSRQSLTSVEVSEAHSLIKASKVDSNAPGRSSLALKLGERSTRSSSMTPEASAGLSRRSLPGLKKLPVVGSRPVDDPKADSIQADDFIPVIAKVSKTSLVCPKHPLEIKSVGKLKPPRKYPSTKFNEEIDDKPLTSRTTVSQSSEGSRRNFSSVKSIPRVAKLHVKRIDDSRVETNRSCLSAPLSGRRVLEPLNLVPKMQENILNNVEMNIERRRKIASELSEIISGQSEMVERKSPSRMNKFLHQNRTRRTESFDSGSLQRPKKLVVCTREKKSPNSRRKSSSPDKEVSSGAKTPKERPLVERRRPATEKQSRKLAGHFSREEKDSESSKKKSVDILDSEWNPRNDGKSISLIASRDSRPEGNSFREIEVFKQLPNVICASLTRHSSLKTPIIENLNDNGEMTSAIRDLKKSIQDDRRSNSDKDFQNTIAKCLNYAANKKSNLDNVSSSRSLTSIKVTQSRGSFTSQTKIPVKITLAAVNDRQKKNSEVEEKPRSEVTPISGKIYSFSTFQNRESAHDDGTEAGQPDSQSLSFAHSSSNSQQNTNRSAVESAASISVSRADKIPGEEVAELTLAIESFEFEEKRTGNSHTEVISIVDVRDTKSLECIYKTQLSPSETDEPTVIEALLDGEKCSLNSSRVSNCKETLNDEKASNNYSTAAEFASCVIVEEQRVAEILNGDESRPMIVDNHQSENVSSVKFGDSDLDICEKKSTPSSGRSATKSRSRFPLEEKSFSSTSKWDVTVVNNVRKSQDRFPFTISASASRKTSRFKVAQQDVSLDQLLPEEGPKKILANNKSGDEIPSPTKALVLSLDEFADKIADDPLSSSWNFDSPKRKLNDVFYGCKEEPRTLMPSAVKGMVKKFSARLGCVKKKRKLDPDENAVRILYRNNKCRGESVEGSSSVTSLQNSQFLCNNLVSTSSVRWSTAGKTVKPKKSTACISASLQHTPRKSYDRNDLWVQDFDSEVEFDGGVEAEGSSERNLADAEGNSGKRKGYSIFFAKCKKSGITETVKNESREDRGFRGDRREAGDTRNIAERKQDDLDEIESRSPKTPANSYEDEFRIKETESKEFRDSGVKSGCCCFRICHLFALHSSLPGEVEPTGLGSSKKRRRMKFWNKD